MLSRKVIWSVRRCMCNGLFATAAMMAVFACATQSVPQFQHAFVPAKHRKVRVEPCRDRSGFKGGRDLAAEATQALVEKLKVTHQFEVAPDASLVLTCEIEGFAEGNAFQRWLLPGWGVTEAKMAVMVWEKPEDNVLGVLRSQSKVEAGGLYTVGADQYILSVAVDDIVKQLEGWSKSGSGAEP